MTTLEIKFYRKEIKKALDTHAHHIESWLLDLMIKSQERDSVLEELILNYLDSSLVYLGVRDITKVSLEEAETIEFDAKDIEISKMINLDLVEIKTLTGVVYGKLQPNGMHTLIDINFYDTIFCELLEAFLGYYLQREHKNYLSIFIKYDIEEKKHIVEVFTKDNGITKEDYHSKYLTFVLKERYEIFSQLAKQGFSRDIIDNISQNYLLPKFNNQ